jgi:glucosylceramidase
MQGGPNWVNNFVYAPILVNASGFEYYKEPMFYVLAHFSKLLPPDSVKIESILQQAKIPKFESVAFQRPDGAVVLLALNLNDQPVSLTIDDPKYGKLTTQISARAIKSYLWWDNHLD